MGQTERLASALLGGTALMWGVQRAGLGGAVLGALGTGLLYRGVTGHCPVYARLGAGSADRPGDASARTLSSAAQEEPEHARTLTIGRPSEELFRAWQTPEVQTRIMAHFASVSADESGRLRWRVRAPLGRVLSFETALAETRANELLVWRSIPGGELETTWTLQLRKAPADYGTEVTLRVRFAPTGGLLPHMLDKLLGLPVRLVTERALRNFKALVETGEIPSAFHNPSARRGARSDAEAPHALRASP